MRIRLFILFFFTSYSLVLYGQDDFTNSPVTLYRTQKQIGVTIHTAGLGANYVYAKYKDAKNLRFYSIEFLNIKHEKERKRVNDSYDINYKTPRGFVYGKVNSFLVLRPTIGKKKIFTKKTRRKGVEFGQLWHFGPSIGMLKPVYLEIIDYNANYFPIERYDPVKHDLNNIFGRASVLKGVDEIKFEPGLFIKYGLNFEYSSSVNYLQGIEVGIAADLYLNKIEIMAEEILGLSAGKNKRLFVNLYLNYYLGRKYTK